MNKPLLLIFASALALSACNTSTSNNSNGGQVMRRARTLGQQGTVVVRVVEP